MPGASRDGVSVISGARARINNVDLSLFVFRRLGQLATCSTSMLQAAVHNWFPQQHDDIGQGEFLDHLGVRVLSQRISTLCSLMPRLLFQ